VAHRYAHYIIYKEAGEYGNLPIRDSRQASGQIERLNSLLDAVVVGIYSLLTDEFQWRLPLEEQLVYQDQILNVTSTLELAETRLDPV
jgi:hypothetical protein